jgi:hypothetical protein
MTPVAITFLFATWVVQQATVFAVLFSLLISALIILCIFWRKLVPRRLNSRAIGMMCIGWLVGLSVHI